MFHTPYEYTKGYERALRRGNDPRPKQVYNPAKQRWLERRYPYRITGQQHIYDGAVERFSLRGTLQTIQYRARVDRLVLDLKQARNGMLIVRTLRLKEGLGRLPG